MLTWLVIGLAHSVILYVYYHLPILIAIEDSLVYNLLYAGMALNFWYAVRYLSIEYQRPIFVLIAHIISAKLFLLIWLLSGNFLMHFINEENRVYDNFVFATFLGRSIVGMFYYFITVLLFYLYIYYNSFKEKLVREANLKALIKESELSLLRSQLNPHFIFNSLNSISSLTMLAPEKAQSMIIKLSTYLRFALENNTNSLIEFSQEMENCLLYLDIEKIRFDDKLIFKMEIDEEVKSDFIPTMILQPLIENAIKHGVYESIEPVNINFSAQKKSDFLYIRITNTFERSDVISNRIGHGLLNVKERLQLIYGKQELLRTEKNEQIFEVHLFIPQVK